MKRLFVALTTSAIAAAAFAAPPAASPREVVLDRIALPYALSYAACAHRGTESCAELRTQYVAQAEQTFRTFGSIEMLQKRPRFDRLLDFIDRDAERLRAGGAAPSPALVNYMACLGDTLQADSRFTRGVAVDPLPALDRCVAERKAIPVANLSTDEDRRTYRYLFNIEAIVNTNRYTNVRDGLLGRPNFGPI